jgi:hypothetical protein
MHLQYTDEHPEMQEITFGMNTFQRPNEQRGLHWLGDGAPHLCGNEVRMVSPNNHEIA